MLNVDVFVDMNNLDMIMNNDVVVDVDENFLRHRSNDDVWYHRLKSMAILVLL